MGDDLFVWGMTHSAATLLSPRPIPSCSRDVNHSSVTSRLHLGRDVFIWDVTRLYGMSLIYVGREVFIRDKTYSYGP